MKKVFFTAFLAGIITNAGAQLKFGILAGVNGASVTQKITSGNQTTTRKYKTKAGFTVGAFADVPITASLTFRPGLNYTAKGGKFKESTTFLGITTTTESIFTFNYLELPLSIIYKYAIGSGNIFAGAGPVIGLGLSGNSKAKQVINNLTTFDGSQLIKFDGKENNNSITDNKLHLKALDFGANFLVGYQLENNVFAKLSYTTGFSNISPDGNSSIKNKGFNFTVGYVFGGDSKSK
jgi:hypothetical protein